MLDITKTYEQYKKNKNNTLLKGLNTLFTGEAILQYVVLQMAFFKKDKGITLESLCNNTAISIDYLDQILNELVQNEFLIQEKDIDLFTITDKGKNFVILSYFYNLEQE